ncbi:hypothetical protein KC19_2G132100 [Ceratodon purpureus]|uniref:non-specific serine/threonine protein kinase n=1 Tax=Ceratodon purpureus TaxID=3225 RepID=A0A8T0IVJ5_CERPU|nr:hypothetical protein KC19_2G132100 [Ceratodon purpureus]
MDKQCTYCCGLFWFGNKSSAGRDTKSSSKPGIVKRISKEHLLSFTAEENDKATKNGVESQTPAQINLYSLPYKANVGSHGPVLVLPFLRAGVKETRHEFQSNDSDGSKMVNEYVQKCKIGTGSTGKVVLYQSKKDEKLYAIKILHKPRLTKLRVSPTETAMMDVLREIAIMKRLDHPNVVKLYEVIDDPESERLYMVMEYAEGNWIFEGSGPPGGIGEAVAREYFRDVVAGLSYLHNHNVVHGDIKPENLLISGDGSIKICDFGCSRMFEGENDELRRSPGTPVYTAPECCSGSHYSGRTADIWALGCTLYCMVMGRYPFLGDTFPSVFEKIVKQPLFIPEGTDPDLADLLRGLLCKDPRKRMPVEAVATHPWLSRGFGQVQAPSYKAAY